MELGKLSTSTYASLCQCSPPVGAQVVITLPLSGCAVCQWGVQVVTSVPIWQRSQPVGYSGCRFLTSPWRRSRPVGAQVVITLPHSSLVVLN